MADKWVLVPVEPTADMRAAGRDMLRDLSVEQLCTSDAADTYRAMIDAAPASPSPPGVDAVAVKASGPEVERIEMEDWSKGYAEEAEPIWRIVLDGYCADFPSEGAARNFAAAIDRRSALTTAPAPVEAGGEAPETRGPYEARICKGMPTDCCDYGVVSLSEGREVCRVWREQDARAIAAALATPAGGEEGRNNG